MKKVWILSKATILEALRRKDLYVILILAFVIIGGAGLVNFFGVAGLQKFLKDISLTVITALTIIISVTVSARQLPFELENRTLYPLLAKPISRFHFLMGKYVGALIISAFTLAVFALLFLMTLRIFHASTTWIFAQAFYLRFLSLAMLVALALCLSLFVTQSANVTITLLLYVAGSIFSTSIVIVYPQASSFAKKALILFYWLLPHLELFDISKKVIHDWPPIPLKVMLILTAYALIYTYVLLFIAYLRFRRKML
jgi:ABC-type transport system involved in multi-copper enzyme maturation permease subunit